MNSSFLRWSICLLVSLSSLYGQTARKVTGITITVSDLESILPFYQEVLTFEPLYQYELSGLELQKLYGIQENDLEAKVVALQLGQQQIELIEFVNEDRQFPIPYDSRSNDLWFQHIAIVVSDMEKAYQRLRDHKITHVSTAPQTLPEYLPAAAGISAFYFRDPDGHNLEIIYYPPGKGDPHWQIPTDRLFLGIDHTAIGIRDTERSTVFYQDLLGLKIAGNSENYGPEQEHLNQVFGAHLIITGLKAKEGIGIEFLEYLAPPGGRPFPVDSQPTDLWHWHSILVVEDATTLYQQLKQADYTIVSSGLLSSGGRNRFLVRDPDGHAVLITDVSDTIKNKKS